MSANTKIEWADHTFNPWIGCTKVGPGCDNCYAKADFDDRKHRVTWGAGQARSRTKTWGDPVRWNKEPYYECTCCGWRGNAADPEFSHPSKGCIHDLVPTRARVFCASLADVFDNEVPDAWRLDLFRLIRATPNLDWLMLTKRIGNAPIMLANVRLQADEYLDPFPWPNVWIGATIVNQTEADRDIPKLLTLPAAKRFLSMEPLLGPVDLGAWLEPWNECGCCGSSFDFEQDRADLCPECGEPGCMCTGFGLELRNKFDDAEGRLEVPEGPKIHWVIAGGESGPNARPMHPEWARSLRDQCQAAGVPFLFKQWGEHDLSYDRDRDDPDYQCCNKMDKLSGRWINLAGGHGFNGARVHYAHKVGKKAAGRLLDGREWNGVPA